MPSRPEPPTVHVPRRSPLAWALIVAALASFAASAAPAAAQLAVAGVDPDGALPGEPVAIFGTGFGRDPDALLCWVDTGGGGFPFEVTAATDGRIDAVLGAVPSAATGAVKVWKGKRHPLADRVILSQGRLFSASGGEVFVTGAAAQGPAFSAFAPSPGAFGSVTVRGEPTELRLDLGDFDPGDGGGLRVRVTVVIETGGDSGSGSPGNLEAPPNAVALRAGTVAGSPAWAAALTVGADAAPPTPEALAAGLADVLQDRLGSVGLTARAEGTEVVVGHALGIQAGFLDLASQ